MKKVLAILLCAVMLSVLAVPVMAADVVLPTAPKADIVLDGTLDSGYGDWYTLDKYREGGSGTGATGRFCSAWNDTGIFYYVEVYDKTPNHNHTNQYERDNVEFFIDWNSAAGDANNVADENPSWQVRIASAPSEDGNQSSGTLGDDVLVAGTDFVTKALTGSDLSGGYIIEVRLPIALTEGTAKALAEGANVFVDFQIADNEADESRSSQVFIDPSDPDVDNQWQWPYSFRGVLPLGAAKPAPVEEPAAEVAPAADDAPAADTTPAPAATTTAVKTGDEAIMFAVLAIALVGAFAVAKRVNRNRV